jgi:excisionase family DNA binding protein
MKVTVNDLRAQRNARAVAQPIALLPTISSDEWLVTLGLAGKAVLTIDEVAALLRVSERTIRERIRTGDVPSMHIGRRVLIPVPQPVGLLLGYPPGDEH